jgi:hypothetical protein
MIKCGHCGDCHHLVADVRWCAAMWEEWNSCACGGDRRDGGDHRRCRLLDMYDDDDLRRMI